MSVVFKDKSQIITKYGYPFNLDMAVIGVLFMFIGSCLRKTIDKYKNNSIILIFSIIAVLGLTTFTVYTNLPKSLNPTCNHIEMSVGSIGNIWLFFFNATALSFAMIAMSLLIDKININKSAILYLGKNSLTILCTHGILLSIASKINDFMGLYGTSDIDITLRGLISYLIVATVSIPIIFIIKQYAPNLLGK